MFGLDCQSGVKTFRLCSVLSVWLAFSVCADSAGVTRSAEFYVDLGDRKLEEEDAVSARRFYEKAYENGLCIDSLMYLLGRSFEKQGKLDSALVCNLAMNPKPRSGLGSAGYSQRQRLYARLGWDPCVDEELRKFLERKKKSELFFPDFYVSAGGGAGMTRLWRAHEPFTQPLYAGSDSVEMFPYWGMSGKLRWRFPIRSMKLSVTAEGGLRDHEAHDFSSLTQLYRMVGGQLGIEGPNLRFSLLSRLSRIRLYEPNMKLGAETSYSSISHRAFHSARLQVILSTPFEKGCDPDYSMFAFISVDQTAVQNFGFTFNLYSQVLKGEDINYPYILVDAVAEMPDTVTDPGYGIHYCTQPLRYISFAPEIRVGGSPVSYLRLGLGVQWQSDIYFDDTRWHAVRGKESDAHFGELSGIDIEEVRKRRLDHIPSAEGEIGMSLPGGSVATVSLGYERTISNLHSLRPFDIPHSRWSASLKWTMLRLSSPR